MANVKGSAVACRVSWVRLNHGQAGVERLSAVVSPGVQAWIRDGVTVAKWYPFDEYIELNEAIDKMFGIGDGALVRELGRWAAEATLTTIYRLFYKVGTVRWVLARATRLWHLHYDAGELAIRELSGGIMEMAIQKVPEPSCTHCLSVQGWCERSIELSGGKQVETVISSCRRDGARDCCLRARWF